MVVAPNLGRALAVYAGGDFQHEPALTSHDVGDDHVVYVGGGATHASLVDIVGALRRSHGLESTTPPVGVEQVRLRRPDGRELVFLLDHTDEDLLVPIDGPLRDHLGGETHDGTVALRPFGVALLERIVARIEQQ